MPHDIVRADYGALEQMAERFMLEHERVLRVQQAVAYQVSVLRRGGWDAEGAAKFYNEMDGEVQPAIGRLVDALLSASHTVRQISVILREAEEEAAACLRGAADEGLPTFISDKPDVRYRLIADVNQETPTPEPDSPPIVPTSTPTPQIEPIPTPVDYSTPTPTPVTPESASEDGAQTGLAAALPMAAVIALSDGPEPFIGDILAVGFIGLVALGIITVAQSSSNPLDSGQAGSSAAADAQAGAAGGEAEPDSGDNDLYRTSPETGQQVIDPRNLPANPDDLLEQGWVEMPSQSPNRRTFQGPDGNIVDYDRARTGLPGWRGRDHYHVRNPNRPPNPSDHSADYLDINGNPVPNGNQRSHIPADPLQR